MSIRDDENYDPAMDVKHYGTPDVDTTGMPPALAERVKKKPGRPPKPKTEPAAVDLKTHIEELRGKRAAEAAERKAMAEEIERLKAELAKEQEAWKEEILARERYDQVIESLRSEVEELQNDNDSLRKRLAVSGRRVKLSEAKWRIWKDGQLVADGLEIGEAAKNAGVSARDLYRMRQHSIHWKALVEGDMGYDQL